jgi:hypothetical protein
LTLPWGEKLVDLGISGIPTNAAIFGQGLDDRSTGLVELPLLVYVLLSLGDGLYLRQ